MTSCVRPSASVTSAMRARFMLVRSLSEPETLKLGLGLALGTQARTVVDYSHSKQILISLPGGTLGMTDPEWAALFTTPRAVNSKLASEVVGSAAFAPHLKRIQAALQHTLQEPNLKSAFDPPLSKLLCFLALNTPADGCIERLETVLGSVVRTDRRLLEDLRASYEAKDGLCDVMLLGRAIDGVVHGIL